MQHTIHKKKPSCNISLLLPSQCQDNRPSVCQTIINLSFACQTPISMSYWWVELTRVTRKRKSKTDTRMHTYIYTNNWLNYMDHTTFMVVRRHIPDSWLDSKPPRSRRCFVTFFSFKFGFLFASIFLRTQHPLQSQLRKLIYIIFLVIFCNWFSIQNMRWYTKQI